eukprot:CCRYP_014346-RA/>CCRYP_014346-RA protein AED:0.10 eAED:0.10 QI:378/1/1/1/1/1/3/200/449
MTQFTLQTYGRGSRISLSSRMGILFVVAMIHSTVTCALLSVPSNSRTYHFAHPNSKVAKPQNKWIERANRNILQLSNKRQSLVLAASMAPIPHSNLAVRLDRPILAPVESCCSARSSSLWPSLLAVLLSDVCKTAIVAFFLAIGVSLAAKFLSQSTVGGAETGKEGIRGFFQRIKNFFSSLLSSKSERVQRSTPMPFEGDGGWGKCTLRSKRKIGSKFTVYEFALPKSEYSLPLGLGQQLDFCCLSLDDDVVTGSFYPYEMNDGERGVVRVVVPNRDAKGNAALVGLGSSKFIEVLHDLRPGEEVAIRPGKPTLTYRGEHVPVTDMVYIASGLGIVPIVDQVKAITPKGSSSVKVISVVWINDERSDFDLAMEELENEYTKYSTKLAVSCILDDVIKNPMEENAEVEEAVPYFNAGTMAVISGPKRFSEKVKAYLMRKGYPENCVCVLP